MSKGIFEYQEEMSNDLISVFRTKINESQYPVKLNDILIKTANSPSRRFWVSPERAFIVISAMEKGQVNKRMLPNKKKMYDDIYKRVQELRQIPEYENEKLFTLVCIAVETAAPCFYITPQSAAVIIHRIKKRRRVRKCLQLNG